MEGRVMRREANDIQNRLATNPSQLLKLVDKNLLIDILRSFTDATGLTANIVTTEGTSIFSRADSQNMCEFCQLIRKLERKKGLHRCTGSYKRAGEQAVKSGEPNIFRCPAGLVEWIAPIMQDNIHIGSIICGQVLLWEPEEFFWIELEEKNRELTDDIEPLIEAAKKLQVVSAEKVQAASKLLALIANNIVHSVGEEVKRQQEETFRRELLEREEDTRLELEQQLNPNSITYFYDQMRSMSKSIAGGEYDKARSIFTVIVADVLEKNRAYRYGYERIFELLVTVSHAAIDAGVDPDECMQLTMEYCDAERLAGSNVDLGNLAFTTFDRLIEATKQHAAPGKQAVDDMLGFIRAHYRENLTLKDVADSVQLSPYYASRLFKEDRGMTIMAYVTKAKMEEAKLLLANPKHRVEEIAAYLGYADPSYFARVFKKTEGVSPSTYRLNH